MKRPVDHDGKSKSAAAVDVERHPNPGEDSNPQESAAYSPTYSEIAARAHQLWLEQGQPSDSAERNWLEAERELRASATSRRLVERVQEQAGSVQR